MIRIISGTNRPGNLSLKLAFEYQERLSRKGLPGKIYSLEDLPIDVAFNDLYGKRSPVFRKVQDMVDHSQTFVFIVPEYNGSLPGILKLFIDACDYPGSFKDKKIAMVGLSAGDRGNSYGLNHLQDIMEYLGATVLTSRVIVPKVREIINGDGRLFSEAVFRDIDTQIDELRSLQVTSL